MIITQSNIDGNSNKPTGQHFKTLCSEQLNNDTFESDDPVIDFSNTLLEIAERTIPKSSINPKPKKPWFDDECKQSIKERKKAEKAFR